MSEHLQENSDSERLLLDYLRGYAAEYGRRLRFSTEQMETDVHLADLAPGNGGTDSFQSLADTFGIDVQILKDDSENSGTSDWKLSGDTLVHRSISPEFTVGMLPSPPTESEPVDDNAFDIPDDWSAIQVAGSWMFDGFHHPASGQYREAWRNSLSTPRRTIAWGFSMIPHPAGLASAPMAFFCSGMPQTVEQLRCSAVTTGPLAYYTVDGKPPGQSVPFDGKWLEINFKAADMQGLEYIAFHVDGVEKRRLEARGRRMYDGVMQLKLPETRHAVWATCKSTDGRMCIVNPIWIE